MTLEILIKGSPTAIRYSGVFEIIEFNQISEIASEKSKTRELLPNPKSKEKSKQAFTAFNPSKKFFLANCSETI